VRARRRDRFASCR